MCCDSTVDNGSQPGVTEGQVVFADLSAAPLNSTAPTAANVIRINPTGVNQYDLGHDRVRATSVVAMNYHGATGVTGAGAADRQLSCKPLNGNIRVNANGVFNGIVDVVIWRF